MFIVQIYVSNDKEPKYIDDEGCKFLGSLTINCLNGETNTEVEQTIIFGESNLTFRARQCGSVNWFETSFDMLDEANVPDILH